MRVTLSGSFASRFIGLVGPAEEGGATVIPAQRAAKVLTLFFPLLLGKRQLFISSHAINVITRHLR